MWFYVLKFSKCVEIMFSMNAEIKDKLFIFKYLVNI